MLQNLPFLASIVGRLVERFSFECWKYKSGNYCGFGLLRFRIGWVACLISTLLVWFWFNDTQMNTALCKKLNGIYIENKLVELNLDNTE